MSCLLLYHEPKIGIFKSTIKHRWEVKRNNDKTLFNAKDLTFNQEIISRNWSSLIIETSSFSALANLLGPIFSPATM